MVIFSFIVTLLYVILITGFIYGFNRIKSFELTNLPSKTPFSILIPFRNEAENLPALLASIKALNYPEQFFQVIFIDDDSHDDSVKIIRKICHNESLDTYVQIISNNRHTHSPKKDAITAAIKITKYDWIITTDADCTLPKYWLDSFDEYIQKTNAGCIVAPVTYFENNNFLNRFQLLDVLSLQGATVGGFGLKMPFLCNGANFAYRKTWFSTLNGFDGNTNVASGDDIFLLEKIAKAYPKQLHYLKCSHAIVKTHSESNWVKLIAQRLRWAAKTSAYHNGFGKLTGLLVLLMNVCCVTLILLTIMGFFKLKTLLYILVIKFNIDFYLIYIAAGFFNQKTVLRSYIFGFLLYPFFSVYIAFLSVFKSYTWKGRTFRK